MEKFVLVVDDEPVIRETIQEAIELYGFSALTAANGLEAMRVLTSRKDISLVLLDLMMPGMDGRQFIKEYQAEKDKVPVVIVSANRDIDVMPARENIHGYLKKPIELEELIRTVEQFQGVP